MLVPGCGLLGDPPTDSCPKGTDCDGVDVWCKNDSQANYWWKKWDGLPPSTRGCGAQDDHCCTATPGTPGNECWVKEYELVGIEFASMGPLCVGQGVPAPLDPLEEGKWVSLGETGFPPGHFPDIDDEIREWCTARCEQSGHAIKPSFDVFQNECEDANWTGHTTRTSWIPAHGYDCPVSNVMNADDPDGFNVPWNLVGGPSSPVPLHCDLDDNCSDLFYPTVAAFVPDPGTAGFIEPETRYAHYLGVDGSGSELTLDPGQGSPDTQPLYGIAEYTAIDCRGPTGAPADVCPFYLANLIAYNTTSSWKVRLEVTQGPPRNKEISNVKLDLMQSTLGIHHKGLDKIAFAPGALRLNVEFEVDGQQQIGNGTHVYMVENVDYVFADYDDGELTISHGFPFQNDTATLTVTVVPDEHPPLAAHDLQVREECDVGGGLRLDQGRSLSSDPDSDIVFERWWVDGVPCVHGCVMPVGIHSVSIEAHDARGAVHRTAEESVEVIWASPCIPT